MLDQAGLSRRAAVSVPLFTLVPRLVVGTNRIATVHARLAELYARSLPIRILAPPVAFPALTEVLEWHYHEEEDPCLSWFRKAIVRRAALAFGSSTSGTVAGPGIRRGHLAGSKRKGRLVLKMIITCRRNQAMSRPQFFHHLRHVHWPLIQRHPDVLAVLTAYVQNHSVLPGRRIRSGRAVPHRRRATP